MQQPLHRARVAVPIDTLRLRASTARRIGDVVVVCEREAVSTVVADLQPMLHDWGEPTEAARRRALAFVASLAEIPSVRSVHIWTNSSVGLDLPACEGGAVIDFRSRARKPVSRIDGAEFDAPVLVVGDQLFTDGLLAIRLGARFVEWDCSPRLRWPRIQRLVGRTLLHPLFAWEAEPDA